MGLFSFFRKKKDDPAPRPVVLDTFVIEKLQGLIDDIVYMENNRNFCTRSEVIDFINEKLNSLRPKEDIVKQIPEETQPKIVRKIKLKPLTTQSD